MKFTTPLLVLALTLSSVGIASAGPRIVITTGHSHGYCAPRPSYCPPVSYHSSHSYRNCEPGYYSRPSY